MHSLFVNKPLVQDKAVNMFAEHLAECRALAEQASEELQRLQTFSLLKQADDSLQSLQLEAKSAPPAERAKLAKEEAALREELRAKAKELEEARKALLLGAGAGGNTDKLFLAREERRKAAAVTSSLQKGTDRLKEANKISAETEEIGVQALQDLSGSNPGLGQRGGDNGGAWRQRQRPSMAYLSFNETVNANLKFTSDNSAENEEMLKKDLPLRYTWSIWEQIMANDKAAAYSDATHKVAAFSTVQEFWKLWNHMPQPSELFEQDRHFQFQLKPTVGGGQVDEYWNNLVLGVIGATIEPANMITGIRLVDKLSGPRAAGVIRLEVWFTNYEDSSAVQALKKSVEKCMATRLDGTVGTPPKCETKPHQTAKH
eukprot:g17384.t1